VFRVPTGDFIVYLKENAPRVCIPENCSKIREENVIFE
jgi:hypothetical protein